MSTSSEKAAIVHGLIALLLFVASTNAAYLSVTFSDASCSAGNIIAFYYDTRASVTCLPSSCAVTGDGNYFQVLCPTSLSIDTSSFALVNYFLSLTGCSGETVVYGGILELSAVRVRTPLAMVTSTFRTLTATTFEYTKCTLASVCTTVEPPTTCTYSLSLEVGTYWRGVMPTSTPVAAPVTAPVTSPSSEPISSPVTVPTAPSVAPVVAPVFGFTITSVYIASDGNLAVLMTTNTFNNNAVLSSPTVTTQPTSVVLLLTNSPSASSSQTWTFRSTTPLPSYSGSYTIEFTRTQAGEGSSIVTAQFTLQLSANDVYTNADNVLPTSLTFYGSDSFHGTPKTSFTSLDTVFVKSTVGVVTGRDNSSYTNSIYNAWLCYTIDDSTPIYNPAAQQYGCAVHTWTVRPIIQLVMSGVVLSGPLESQFAAVVNDAIQGQDPINSGFRFQAGPLATLKSGKFFVQIENRINFPTGAKRSTEADQAVSNKIQGFNIKTLPRYYSGQPGIAVKSNGSTKLAVTAQFLLLACCVISVVFL